jgi:hypothetical protein
MERKKKLSFLFKSRPKIHTELDDNSENDNAIYEAQEVAPIHLEIAKINDDDDNNDNTNNDVNLSHARLYNPNSNYLPDDVEYGSEITPTLLVEQNRSKPKKTFMNLFRRDSIIAPSEIQNNAVLEESLQPIRLQKRNSDNMNNNNSRLGGKKSKKKYYKNKSRNQKKYNKIHTKKNKKKHIKRKRLNKTNKKK